MKMQALKGTGVALVTPFKKGRIDFDALGRIIEHCIEGGVDYLVSLGTTGESVTLSADECRAIFDFSLKVNAGRLPIVAGMFGGNWTERLVERLHNFQFDGFDAILSSNPAYVKPNQEGIFQHYMKVAAASPLPVIIYNVPGRTSSNVAPETVLRLLDHSDRFVAIKEASGNLEQGMRLLKHKPDNFIVLSGDDPTALALISCGGEGVISVIANAFPRSFSDMIQAGMKGDLRRAQSLNALLYDLHQWLYIDGNPAGIKGALEILGFCSKEVRLPLAPISEAHFESLRTEINKVEKAWKAFEASAKKL